MTSSSKQDSEQFTDQETLEKTANTYITPNVPGVRDEIFDYFATVTTEELAEAYRSGEEGLKHSSTSNSDRLNLSSEDREWLNDKPVGKEIL